MTSPTSVKIFVQVTPIVLLVIMFGDGTYSGRSGTEYLRYLLFQTQYNSDLPPLFLISSVAVAQDYIFYIHHSMRYYHFDIF